MSASLPGAAKKQPHGSVPDNELVADLVRRLAAEFRHDSADEGCVLLDIEVDDLRCLLLRVPDKRSAVELLSPREIEIARMVARGLPNKVIGSVLEISTWTVCTHLRRIFAKIGVGSRAAMVARLAEEGLMHEDSAHLERRPARRARNAAASAL